MVFLSELITLIAREVRALWAMVKPVAVEAATWVVMDVFEYLLRAVAVL